MHHNTSNETLTASQKSESASSNVGWAATRSQRLMSQMLSTLIPNSTEDIFRKYPALLDVPFISLSEILITREIGSGSFGRVYHGIFSFQDVAVKKLTVRNFRDEIDIYDQLSPDDGNDEADKKAKQAAETLLALEKEVAMLKRISFPKVVGFYGVCFEPAAIVSEYCARGSLFDLIARARALPRVACEMSWERRLSMANDAAIGMSFLHNRMDPIIHRDLKSPNLLVDEHYTCKVADFNTAGFVNATEITKSQVNNPRWLAPEIADGKTHNRASDVYPFGIILWELMTWMRPFEYDGEEMTTYNILLGIVRDKLRPEIPPNHKLLGGPCPVYKEYVQLMEECWDQDPEKRPTFSEIHERLQVMKRKTVELGKAQEPSSPRIIPRSIKTRSPRQTSPEPKIARSPRSESPFSKRPIPESVSVTTNLTDSSRGGTKKGEAIVEVDAPVEECLTSPFQNGPPSMGTASIAGQSHDSQTLANPPSFANWSVRGTRPSTGPPSVSINFSDVVQHRPSEVVSAARRRWNLVSKEFGLEDLVPDRTTDQPRAFERWDSLRTAIFGAPASEQFQEQFGSFLKGDETEELKKRLKDIENRGSPGLRILKALMELREAKEKEAKEEADKPSGWCLVKHLMLINLPTPVHPLWQMISDNIKPTRSGDGMLSAIAESHSGQIGTSVAADAKRLRARALWKTARHAFIDDDPLKTKPVLPSRWQKLKELLFSDEEEEEQEESTAPSPASTCALPACATPDPSLNDCFPVEGKRKTSKWSVVRRTFLTNVVEKNWDYLTRYARTQVINAKTSGLSVASKVRKLAIVDEEPPSPEKWEVVRGLLMVERLGKEWDHLREKAKRNVVPPSGTEWEIFRWLFFENKKLRNQTHWTFIKDLFLKTETRGSEISEGF